MAASACFCKKSSKIVNARVSSPKSVMTAQDVRTAFLTEPSSLSLANPHQAPNSLPDSTITTQTCGTAIQRLGTFVQTLAQTIMDHGFFQDLLECVQDAHFNLFHYGWCCFCFFGFEHD